MIGERSETKIVRSSQSLRKREKRRRFKKEESDE